MCPKIRKNVFLLLLLAVVIKQANCSESAIQNQISNNNSSSAQILEGLSTNFTVDSAFPDEIEPNPYNEAEDEHSPHEVVAKPVKKKPYRIQQKPSDIDDHLPYKDFDAHSETFDFNLDDLEDVHQTFKRGDLSSEEVLLLRDASKLRYDEISTSDNDTMPIFVEATQIHTSDTGTSVPPLVRSSIDGLNSSLHVYKITKSSKSKTKGVEVSKKDEVQAKLGSPFNSVNGFIIDQSNISDSRPSNENFFQLLVNFYDHFYWQPSDIRIRVSPACGVEVLSYLSALNNNYEWAQKAYDSSGRYRGQYHYGNDLWLGEKMFCEELNLVNDRVDRKRFEFGFFVVRVAIMMPPLVNSSKIIQIGECLPKTCTTNDVQAVMDLDPHARIFAAQNTTKTALVEVIGVRRVPSDYCIWKDSKFQIFGGICVGLAVIIVIATIFEANLTENDNVEKYPIVANTSNITNGKLANENANGKGFELYQMNVADNNNVEVDGNFKYKKTDHVKNGDAPAVSGGTTTQKKGIGFHHKILLCFALGSNASTILSVENNHEDPLSCLHGIRVFSLLWTIMVHTYLQLFTIGENRFRRKVSERTLSYQIIGNATFSVDSFFFISGLLVTVIFLRHHKDKNNTTKEFIRKGAIQSAMMVIYRYIRLTPAYLFVIIFNELALRYIFNGSVFQPTIADHLSCAAYWWRNILYINNWYPLKELCMIWSWYLANDMQFYIMAIVILITSTRYFKFSFLTILFFLITSWGTAGIFSLHHHYTHKVAEPFESFDFLYDKPWQRIGTYIIGMITGYIIHRVKTPPKVPFVVNLVLWAASLGLLFILIFGAWEGELGIIATAFYVSIGHTAWGVGLVWITLSCCWGLSRPINKILSYKGFLPLSRLTYCTYLVHPVMMIITSFQMEGPIHLEHSMILTVFLGNAVLSFIIAFFISVSFEAPVIRLLKLIFRK